MERTLVLVKPSGVARGLVGEVISRMERRGLTIKVARMLMVTREMAERHYAEHQGKDFYADLVDHITSAPVFAMVVEGPPGRSHRAHDDGRHQSARTRHPVQSEAILAWICAATWCTVPTAWLAPRGR